MTYMLMGTLNLLTHSLAHFVVGLLFYGLHLVLYFFTILPHLFLL